MISQLTIIFFLNTQWNMNKEMMGYFTFGVIKHGFLEKSTRNSWMIFPALNLHSGHADVPASHV